MKKIAAVIFLVIAGILAIYFSTGEDISEFNSIIIGDTKIEIKTAETPEERTLGLSGQKSLPHNRGLFFIYDQPDLYGIWMKEMNFPIDIIWFDSDKKIVSISKNAKPESFPEVFWPDFLASYVLEVNAGFVDENGIKIGDNFGYFIQR
ncbi:MAG: hypothetical protein A3F96_01000 [Parcubacteria group bacterium RIFCSPLOWO2_12_FULL_40_10]|nr:MAG: hypothetical protein A3F96_01000 [Parcubacteria group bacterium RIFCSPLOWO2_12_FULL_40_10]